MRARARFLLLHGSRAGAALPAVTANLASLLPCVRHHADTIILAGSSSALIDLPAICGRIAGRLFDRSGLPTPPPERADQLAMASSRGRHLMTHFSGSYAAFWSERGILYLLRDPSGTMPLFYARLPELVIACSDPDLLWASGLVEPKIDIDGIAHYLRFPLLPAAQTCIDGLVEVMPGQLVALGTATRVEQLWKPSHFATQPKSAATADPSAALAKTIDTVVAGQVAGQGRIALELSGGLDSSIVAASLSKAGADWTGLNLVPRAIDGDERRYARQVATHLDRKLVELPTDDAMQILLQRPTRMTARPGGVTLLRGIDRLLHAAAERSGAGAVFGGGGGDNVFCAIYSTAPVLDAFAQLGLQGALAAIHDVAAVTQTTQWDVIRHLGRRWVRDHRRQWRWPATDSFLHRDVRPSPILHPWLAFDRRVLPGTRGHIAALLRIHPVLDAHDRMADSVMMFPLLSQPVMEACLAIPSWQWIIGGRDRAVVRNAFAGRLPTAILERRTKGRLDTVMAQAFDRQNARIRELLCDGMLARHGLFDRDAIAMYLGADGSGQGRDYARLVDLVDAELWIEAIRDRQGIARAR